MGHIQSIRNEGIPEIAHLGTSYMQWLHMGVIGSHSIENFVYSL